MAARPYVPRLPLTATPADRFWSKVDASGDCWIWTGSTLRGYGLFTETSGGKRHWRSHRWAWEHLVGPIAEGLTLDHLCRVRACVNPDHLEPVTNRENILRGQGLAAQYARRTACNYGHPYSPENTRVTPRRGGGWWRLCLTCEREVRARYEARRDLARVQS